MGQKQKIIIGGSVILLATVTWINAAKFGLLSSPANETTADAVPAHVREADAAASSTKVCDFQTQQKPDRSKLVFNEIAWMGNKESPNNEWLSVQKLGDGGLDVSGFQILNQNQKIK